ncbi:hypothetical protein D0525_23670 [Salmonella enterica]|nr:hypothetical protein D0525_23670 [Salmonella enterica]
MRTGQMAWQRILHGEYGGEDIPPERDSENWKTWHYRADGELTQESGPRGPERYDYDRAGWLKSRSGPQGTERFAWDKAGNPVNECKRPVISPCFLPPVRPSLSH